MKIFITGSNGFIGSELVSHLYGKHEIVTYDIADGQDILDDKQLTDAMKDCDIVVHVAAIPKPEEDKTFADYFRVNCQGTFNVAQAAMKNKVKRLVFTSSTTYYGVEKGIPFVKPIKESNPIVTQHVGADDLECMDCDIAYSTSKVIAEQILANYGMRKKLEVIILRLGPTGKSEPFLGMQLKLENAVQAIEKAITLEKKLWYDAFTIVDEGDNADISKAKDVLGYNPL